MKVIILGAAGMIGHRIWVELKDLNEHQVFGLIRKNKKQYSNYEIFDERIFDGVDVEDWNNVEEILKNNKPDYIINAIGITIRKNEINNLDKALEINSFFPRRLLKWAQENNAHVIHLSTDCVFDGSSGNYYETSQPSAKDTYGKTKFLGEIEGKNATTLRFSCIGRELESHTELLDWFLSQKGKKIKGYTNAMYSGVTTLVVANEIKKIIQKSLKLEGVFQISSQPISKYNLLCLARDNFQLDVEIEKFDNYVSDKTLVCDKFKSATGFKPIPWSEMMKEIVLDTKIKYKEL